MTPREFGRFVWFWQERMLRLLAFLTMAVFAVSLGYSLVIIVLAQRLGSGPAGVGLTIAASGVGIVVGSVLAMRLQRRLTLRALLMGSLLLWSGCWPLWVLAPNVVALAVRVVVHAPRRPRS